MYSDCLQQTFTADSVCKQHLNESSLLLSTIDQDAD